MSDTPTIPIRSALLVSDIHLSQDQPALAKAFLAWLTQHTIQTKVKPESLFILGDLVDAWVGDDQLSNQPSLSIEAQLCDALHAIYQSGIRTYFLHGNRDFLIGAQFAAATGIQLLTDPTVIKVQQQRIALTHGDQLCTRDTAYQAFRQEVRNPTWQAAFLAKPLKERLQIARQLRSQSELEKSGKAMAIMDITQEDADQLAEQLQVDVLIHGHTHRPGHYPLQHGKKRWVLPDWETDPHGALVRGGGLWVDAQGIRAISI